MDIDDVNINTAGIAAPFGQKYSRQTRRVEDAMETDLLRSAIGRHN